MPDITLSRRAPGLTTRRRSVAAPTTADVPTINPAVARDPGLDVPKGAFGGEAVGAAAGHRHPGRPYHGAAGSR